MAPPRDLNHVIFWVLRGGILVSVVLIVIGLLLGAFQPAELPRVSLKPSEVAAKLAALSPAGFLALGVIVMVLTPVARVFLSILAYAAEKDRVYVVLTAIVFVNLLVGIVLGLG